MHCVEQLKKAKEKHSEVPIDCQNDMFGKSCRIQLNLSSQRTNGKKEIGENSSLIPYKNTN